MAWLPDGATGLLIDGRWCASGTGLVVSDKYTLQPLAAIQQARPGDVEAAVAAAAAGNAVVLKPAGRTPLCSVALAQILLDAGLPPGFLQLVCGPGETVGAALVADRRVRFFTFTGSTAVGLAVKQNSGIAKTHLELGSNSASIVAAGADLDLVGDLVTPAG